MLYYLIKFFHLFKQEPLQIFGHFRSLYAEWSEDHRGQLVNEVLYVVPSGVPIDHCPPQPLELEGNQIILVPGHVARIFWHLNNAKYSIDLAMYAIGSTEILNALIAAARRGVRVRLATQTNRKNMNEKFPDISVRRLPTLINTLMHNKFSVIDGYLSLRELLPKGAKEPVTVCVTGSFNWVNYLDSCDDIFITSAPRICKSLEQEFHYIWNNCAFIKH